MRKVPKRLLLAAGLATVLAGALLWYHHQPRYGGHSLSYWLTFYENADQQAPNPAAVKAVASIGEAAVPLLVERIRAAKQPPPRWHEPAQRWFYRLPGLLRFERTHIWLLELGYRNLRDGKSAMAAFAALGEKARPGLAELARIATGHPDAYTRGLAIGALARTGSPGVWVLLQHLEAPATTNQAELLQGLCSSNLVAANPAVVPVLVRFLASSNSPIQCMAANGLGHARQQPEVAVPVLVSTLQQRRDINLLCYAARSLGRLGPCASNAVPDLLATAHLTYGLLLDTAIEAIGRIGPEFVTNAPAAGTGVDTAALLAQLPPAATNTPERAVALRLLQQNSLRSQLTGAFALTRQGQEAGPLMPIYLAAMNDATLRGPATEQLSTLGPRSRSAVPALVAALNSPSIRLRWSATNVLQMIAPAALTNAPLQ